MHQHGHTDKDIILGSKQGTVVTQGLAISTAVTFHKYIN